MYKNRKSFQTNFNIPYVNALHCRALTVLETPILYQVSNTTLKENCERSAVPLTPVLNNISVSETAIYIFRIGHFVGWVLYNGEKALVNHK